MTVLAAWIGFRQTTKSRREGPDSGNKTTKEVPMSSGGIPILGHATLFKKNPPSFLKSVQDKDGPVFRINLAGRDMVIIGDDEKARKQVQFAAPSVLSSTQAVADVGFDYALSQRSIDFGTLFHKHVLKHYFYRGDGSKLFEEAIRDATERAFEQETSPGAPCVVTRRDTAGNGAEGTSVVVNDLIQFSRRMTTRVSIAVFCGSGVSVDHDLVSESTVNLFIGVLRSPFPTSYNRSKHIMRKLLSSESCFCNVWFPQRSGS